MIRRCKPILGTFVEIKITEENSAAYLAVEEAFEEIEEIHQLMSFFDEGSQLSLLNREACERAITVDPRLFDVLALAQKISEVSGGVFDVTLHRSLPEYDSNFSDIELLSNSQVRFKKPLKIDLGGIAKGYAVDKASEILEDRSVTSYIVNAGGDLRAGKTAQKISIRNPQKLDSTIYEAQVCENSIATSAGYFSCQEAGIDGERKRIYPVFQARGKAMEYNNESISVFTKSCATADALTKVATILKEKSSKILAQFDARAIFVEASNQIKFIN